MDFLLIPALFYLAVAMVSGMNIGARHLLPFYAYLFVLVGGGAAMLAASSRKWSAVCGFCWRRTWVPRSRRFPMPWPTRTKHGAGRRTCIVC